MGNYNYKYDTYIVTKKDITISYIVSNFYENKDEDFIFNFLDNKELIKLKYNDEQLKQYPDGSKDLLIVGTILRLPKEGRIINKNFKDFELERINVNELKEVFWSERINNLLTKKSIEIDYSSDKQLFVKRFNFVYIKIYSRVLKKFVNISKYIKDQASYEVGKLGGGFKFTLPGIECTTDSDGEIIPNILLFDDNKQFLSKTSLLKNKGYLNDKNQNIIEYYFEKIFNPQDLIFIKFEEDFKESENVTIDSDEDYDMIGLIDRVTKKVTQSEENIDVDISFTGRDLIKILIEDGSHFFPMEIVAKSSVFSHEDDNELKEEDAFKKFFANYNSIKDKKLVTRVFGKLNEIEVNENTTIRSLLLFIFSRLKNVNGEFFSKDGFWNFFELEIEKNAGDRILYNSNIATMSGSIINFIKAIVKEPFVEIIADTIGDKYTFIVRTPPVLKETYLNNRTINISLKYLKSEDTYFSDEEIYSWYLLKPKSIFFGNSEEYPIIPAVLIERFMKIYGSRAYIKDHEYMFYKTNDPLQNKDRLDSFKQTMEDFKFLLEGYLIEPFLKKGTLTFNNISGIKRGMNLYIPELDMLYYIVGYSHSVGNENRSTTVNVERGLPRRAIDLFYNLIKINLGSDRISSVDFNDEVLEKLYKKKYDV